ncbi:NUDIX hydrolase domain-like protein [Lactarius pseudohatsudake]|nr:NUDIX hydrolase domain-like protein [Lactarius pseudohatsudake]
MATTPVFGIPDEVFAAFSESTRACIERLRRHAPEATKIHPPHPASKPAAVLILLYERAGRIRVLLTTRSKELRSHPGQTALPGGKVDEEDGDVIETAFREANEEVAFPLHSSHVHILCTLDPFVSQYKVIVTPVVALLDDVSILDDLRAAPGEVAHIFDHPVEALLDPELARDEKLVPVGSEDWPYESGLYNFTDGPWLGTTYRMHRFRSTASPVKGLTADILLATARIAYAREPVFQRWGPGQLRTYAEVQRAVETAAVAAVVTSSPLQLMPSPGHVTPTTTVRA